MRPREKESPVTTDSLHDALRALPSVEEVLQQPSLKALAPLLPHRIMVDCVRASIDERRQAIRDKGATKTDCASVADDACLRALAHLRPSLRRVINASGVIIHTNLGRSPLAPAAVDAVIDVARGYSTLEYDTAAQSRGSRHDHVEHLICALTGAEAAIAVNNNAAAVMMVLREFAAGHKAIVSRGELVEIGGSFRIPDIMALSDAHMVEVGTTNKTHLADYARAIDDEVAMLLKVHPSNYRLIGFTESVPLSDLRSLADEVNAERTAADADAEPLLVYEDQGSGSLLRLDCFGAYAEPTVAESLKGGVDLVSFSGDKLLGGPQAGIIAGRADLIDRLKKNPLARALRLDKMTLAALESTLRLYLDPAEALKDIPALRMLSEDADAVRQRAQQLAGQLEQIEGLPCVVEVVPEIARAGGGALPMCDIPTYAVKLDLADGLAQACETYLISHRAVPVVGRIKQDAVLLDARTLRDDEVEEVAEAVAAWCADEKKEGHHG